MQIWDCQNCPNVPISSQQNWYYKDTTWSFYSQYISRFGEIKTDKKNKNKNNKNGPESPLQSLKGDDCLWYCNVKPTGFILTCFESPLYFCFVVGLDKVHFVLLRGNGGKIWQSCLIMVALIILHFSLFSVKCEFHHCNLERIFVQQFLSNPKSLVLLVRLRSAPSTIFGCEDES